MLAIRRYVDRGESSLEVGPGTSFCKPASAIPSPGVCGFSSSPDGLERSSKVSFKIVSSLVQHFVQRSASFSKVAGELCQR